MTPKHVQAMLIDADVGLRNRKEFRIVLFTHFTHDLTRKLHALLHETYSNGKEKKVLSSAVCKGMAFGVDAHFQQMLPQLFVRLSISSQEIQEVDDVFKVWPEVRALLVQLLDSLQVFWRHLVTPCDNNHDDDDDDDNKTTAVITIGY